jgi:hypothetical protein
LEFKITGYVNSAIGFVLNLPNYNLRRDLINNNPNIKVVDIDFYANNTLKPSQLGFTPAGPNARIKRQTDAIGLKAAMGERKKTDLLGEKIENGSLAEF